MFGWGWSTRARLLSGIAVTALSASAALAQTATQPESIETVVVSSNRLQAAGFNAPTPTTVVGAADIDANAQPNVFNTLIELPALEGSTGTQYNTGSTSTGLQGLSGLALRGLSPIRTLVLMDGQRFVPGNFNGVVDVSQMPQMLIQRVDVVTGGASASWGSDAIAGVVNFITDKKYEGFKVNAQGGISTYGDDPEATFQAAAGTSFLGGRAHIEAAGEYSYTAGLNPPSIPANSFGSNPQIGGRNLGYGLNYGSTKLACNNPAGSIVCAPSSESTPGGPQIVYGTGLQGYTSTTYGLIPSGPLGGTAFGKNGVPYQFDLAGGGQFVNGSVVGTAGAGPTGGNTCAPSGCFATPNDPGDQTNKSTGTQFTYVDPLTRGNLYMRASYDLAPETEIYTTITFGAERSQVIPTNATGKNNQTIQCNTATNAANANPFVPASVNAACIANNITNFPLSYNNAQFPQYQDVRVQRDLRRYVVGGDGTFSLLGKDWSWEAYGEHGESDQSIHIHGEVINNRLSAAVTDVTNAQGQIVCANAAAAAAGCEPYNILGDNGISQGAFAYIAPVNGPYALITERQEAFGTQINGTPFKDWAGDIPVVFGLDYREEYYQQIADPYGAGVSAADPNTASYPVDPTQTTPGAPNQWNAGNYSNGRGNYHVSEGFLQVGLPLLNDTTFGKVDADLEGRFEAYSPAGDFTTWKVGFTWDTPLDGLRLRGTQSRDVRAPNLSELYGPTAGLNGSIIDDYHPSQPSIPVRQLNEGNPLLKPERSQTTEVGMVYQPDFLPGFQASIDYYRIQVKGAITSLSLQQVDDFCVIYNEPQYCTAPFIGTANGQPYTATNPPTLPGYVASAVFNLATLTTDGFDFEAAQAFDLQDWGIPGKFGLHALVNHTSKYILVSGLPNTVPTEFDGVISGSGGSASYNGQTGNVFTYKGQFTQTYQADVWGLNLTERWFPNGVISRQYITCTTGCPLPTQNNPTTNNNTVDGAFYLDIGGNWNYSEKTQFYFKVDNVTNLMPPLGGGNVSYDFIGRDFRIGVRFND